MTESYDRNPRRFSRATVPAAVIGLTLLLGLLLISGCWLGPGTLSPSRTDSRDNLMRGPNPGLASSQSDKLSRAEQAFSEGEHLFENSDAGATAMFLEATTLAWRVVCNTAGLDGPKHERASLVYHASLQQLITSSQRFAQLDPRSGLHVVTATGPVQIPIRYRAFAWQPEDFNRWIPVADYEDERLVQNYRRTGWGVPLVIVRERDTDERFMTRSTPFSATALLRPWPATSYKEDEPFTPQVLEVFNPLVVKTLPKDDGQSTPLAADISAPIAWLNQNTPHLNYQAFVHPDRVRSNGQLIMLEPYQAGKIPVIFVHGLLSDPLTWTGLINELRASDRFNDHYQVWVFGYSTGRPFLRSAADLRRECGEALAVSAQANPDPALNRTVLIGHSMGGLVSKLLVTDSDTLLWNAFAERPLASLQTDDVTNQYLSQLFFFSPLPCVERAVFIGTPHGGSPIAQKWEARFASHLVSRSHEFSQEYEEFLRQNRAVIRPFFAKHLPTSVDMLEPQDPILKSMRRLPIAPHVRMHSIIGHGHSMLVGEPADGVVPVNSAHHDNVDSEILVSASHRHLQTHPDTVQEVFRILMLHLEQPPPLDRSRIGVSHQEPPGQADSRAARIQGPSLRRE